MNASDRNAVIEFANDLLRSKNLGSVFYYTCCRAEEQLNEICIEYYQDYVLSWSEKNLWPKYRGEETSCKRVLDTHGIPALIPDVNFESLRLAREQLLNDFLLHLETVSVSE